MKSDNSNKPTHRKHHHLHDYRERCIYHITLVCSDRVPLFGKIVGDCLDNAKVELSPLGFEISEELQTIQKRCAEKGRQVQLLAKVVMPEHIHFVLFVKEEMDCKLQLILRGFKQGCNKRLRAWLEKAEVWKASRVAEVGNLASPNGSGTLAPSRSDNSSQLPLGEETFPRLLSPSLRDEAFLRFLSTITSQRMQQDHALFYEDFDETRLRRKGQLTSMIQYVHNNPKHRWLKQRHRDLLVPMRDIEIAGEKYDAIGNVNLLGLLWQYVKSNMIHTPPYCQTLCHFHPRFCCKTMKYHAHQRDLTTNILLFV